MGTKIFLGGLTLLLTSPWLFPSFTQAGAIIMIVGYILLLFNK